MYNDSTIKNDKRVYLKIKCNVKYRFKIYYIKIFKKDKIFPLPPPVSFSQ